MKIYVTTKFIIIGIIVIVIIIMIDSYIFKIIEAGNNEPFWGDTLHMWIIQVLCIWETSIA